MASGCAAIHCVMLIAAGLGRSCFCWRILIAMTDWYAPRRCAREKKRGPGSLSGSSMRCSADRSESMSAR